MLKVVTYPHSALITKCTDVTNFDNELDNLLLNMFSIMKQEGGIGLAANQLAITKRMFVMELENKQYIFINPVVISKSTNTISYNEGCLSFPNIQQENQRFESIVIRWQDSKGLNYEESFSGLHAICIQHEIDHLNGITFLDHLSSTKKLFAFKKYFKRKKQS